MKTFFSSTFINKETLSEAGIYHPIRLDYYKIINEEEKTTKEKPRFGINVVKTEYYKDDVKIENKKIPYVSNDEKKIEKILKLLKENEVTPIIVEDVLSDFSKQLVSI